MRRRLRVAGAAALSIVAAGWAFGQADNDSDFAADLWAELVEHRLVGPDSIGAVPFARMDNPHSANLVQLETTITVAGVTGLAIVKRGYGEGATRAEIVANAAVGVQNVTVMFRWEAGYDPANMDWFYVGYTPNGVVIADRGIPFAGRPPLCIGCHSGAPGGDYVFLHDGIAER